MLQAPTTSTYVAPITITDRQGYPLELSTATITYAITTKRGGGETLFEVTETDDAVTVEPDGETGTVEVTVPAAEVTWAGVVFEELRVTLGDESLVVSQRSLHFDPSATSP